VTERIRDVGQNVLQSSVQTVSSSSHSYCHIFFLIAFIEDAFIRNIITPCINYNITIHINNNKTAVINNNLLRVQVFILLFKFIRGSENVCSKLIDNPGTRPPKV
jgi:hypothetical protein